MRKQLLHAIEHPEAQKIINSSVGILAGFAAKKLITLALKRTPFGLAATVAVAGLAVWVARHPENVERWTEKLIRFRSNRGL